MNLAINLVITGFLLCPALPTVYAQDALRLSCNTITDNSDPRSFELGRACLGTISPNTIERAHQNRYWHSIDQFILNPSGLAHPADPDSGLPTTRTPTLLLEIRTTDRSNLRVRSLTSQFYNGQIRSANPALRPALDSAEHNALLYALATRFLTHPSERSAISQLLNSWEFNHDQWIRLQSQTIRGLPVSWLSKIVEFSLLMGTFLAAEQATAVTRSLVRTFREPALQEAIETLSLGWSNSIRAGVALPGIEAEGAPAGIRALMHIPLPRRLQAMRSRLDVTLTEATPALRSASLPTHRLGRASAALFVTAAYEGWDRWNHVSRVAPGSLLRLLQFTLLVRTHQAAVDLHTRLQSELGFFISPGRTEATEALFQSRQPLLARLTDLAELGQEPSPTTEPAAFEKRARILEALAAIPHLQSEFNTVDRWVSGANDSPLDDFRVQWSASVAPLMSAITALRAAAADHLALRVPTQALQ